MARGDAPDPLASRDRRRRRRAADRRREPGPPPGDPARAHADLVRDADRRIGVLRRAHPPRGRHSLPAVPPARRLPGGGGGPRHAARDAADARGLADRRRAHHPALRAVARHLHPVVDQVELLGVRGQGALAVVPRAERSPEGRLPGSPRRLRAHPRARGRRDHPRLREPATVLRALDAGRPLHAGVAHGAVHLLRAVGDLDRRLVPVPGLGLRPPRSGEGRAPPPHDERLAVHRAQRGGEGGGGEGAGPRTRGGDRAVRAVSRAGQRRALCDPASASADADRAAPTGRRPRTAGSSAPGPTTWCRCSPCPTACRPRSATSSSG